MRNAHISAMRSKETFLGFISVTDGTAAGLVETTCKYVEDIGHLSLTSKDKKERDEAVGIKKNIAKIDFIINLVPWERILSCTNSTSKERQSKSVDLSAASRLLSISLSELRYFRNSW